MKKFLLLLLSLIFAFNQLSVAQNPGDLDLSFGSGGVVVTSAAQWTDIVLQSDGKLLAVSDIIARFNANGTLDGSFGINGTDTIKIDDTVYNHNAIAIQSDGKILVICNY